MPHSVTAPALAVNDPGLIYDDNIRSEPVIPVVLFIIDKPPAVIPNRQPEPFACWSGSPLVACLPTFTATHFAHLQVALGRMGGGETDDLAIADVHRDIDFARLVEPVLAVLFHVVAEKCPTILVFFCFFARATPDAAIVPIDLIKARIARRLIMR